MKHEKLLLPIVFCLQELLRHLDLLSNLKVKYSSTEAIITVSLKFFAAAQLKKFRQYQFFNNVTFAL
jgi:hypothetical protein